MKLIIPVEFYRKGGVERVIIGLITNLVDRVDQIILIASPNNIKYFKTILPQSPKLVYELWQWPKGSKPAKFLLRLYQILAFIQKINNIALSSFLEQKIQKIRTEDRINYLIKNYQATHCLYVMMNRLNPPNLSIPLTAISYDLFWHFAPMTYAEDYVAMYDEFLSLWLKKADTIFTISCKTRDDILSVFPEYQCCAKLLPVPLSGYPTHQNSNPITIEQIESNHSMLFYFPSSFGIYKDHLTLIKAGIQLAKKDPNLDFKIIFIGKETDQLMNNELALSQQSGTQEYSQYLEECKQIYRENTALMIKYFKGLGYCDFETVEYYYQSASCVVFSSQYEGFGLAISEAIVRGLPVIASDLVVFKEQASLYNCPDRITFFPKGDVDSLATCLEQFIKNPQPKFSEAEIKARFSHWTWEDVAQAYINEWEKLR